jgi:multimeric flavodoxin WrbA
VAETAKILAIVGSARLDGNTNCLVDVALEAATAAGAETEKIVLSQYRVNPCLGHEDCASYESCVQEDDAGWILEKFCESDGVVLATPVYYYNVSAQMKAFIDRNYFLYKRNRKSQARVVGLMVVAEIEGIEDTLHTLRQFVDESFSVHEDKLFVLRGYASRPGEAKRNPELVEAARSLGRQMVESLKRGG